MTDPEGAGSSFPVQRFAQASLAAALIAFGATSARGNQNDVELWRLGNPVPITLSSSNGDGVQLMLMTIAGVLVLGLCVIPPLAAQASDRRRQQRLAKWSGTDCDEWRGGRR